MKVTKSKQKLSLAALIVSLLPFLTLVPAFLNITLPDGVRIVWAVCNIAFALVGLLLSVICVKGGSSTGHCPHAPGGRKPLARGKIRSAGFGRFPAGRFRLRVLQTGSADQIMGKLRTLSPFRSSQPFRSRNWIGWNRWYRAYRQPGFPKHQRGSGFTERDRPAVRADGHQA